jgi:hypothetical protein
MISDMDDDRFERLFESYERTTLRLLRDRHYGPIIRADGSLDRLEALRREYRERQERARAHQLLTEAAFAES